MVKMTAVESEQDLVASTRSRANDAFTSGDYYTAIRLYSLCLRYACALAFEKVVWVSGPLVVFAESSTCHLSCCLFFSPFLFLIGKGRSTRYYTAIVALRLRNAESFTVLE